MRRGYRVACAGFACVSHLCDGAGIVTKEWMRRTVRSRVRAMPMHACTRFFGRLTARQSWGRCRTRQGGRLRRAWPRRHLRGTAGGLGGAAYSTPRYSCRKRVHGA